MVIAHSYTHIHTDKMMRLLHTPNIFPHTYTVQLCIILNNMTHVRQALKSIPVKLDLQTFYDWVESEEKLGKKAEDLISSLLSSSDEDIANKTSHIVVQISRKVGGAGTVDCTAG